jgi:hypothetical protein
LFAGSAQQVRLKRLNHLMLCNHPPNPFIALNAHVLLLQKTRGSGVLHILIILGLGI